MTLRVAYVRKQKKKKKEIPPDMMARIDACLNRMRDREIAKIEKLRAERLSNKDQR